MKLCVHLSVGEPIQTSRMSRDGLPYVEIPGARLGTRPPSAVRCGPTPFCLVSSPMWPKDAILPDAIARDHVLAWSTVRCAGASSCPDDRGGLPSGSPGEWAGIRRTQGPMADGSCRVEVPRHHPVELRHSPRPRWTEDRPGHPFLLKRLRRRPPFSGVGTDVHVERTGRGNALELDVDGQAKAETIAKIRPRGTWAGHGSCASYLPT